LTELADAVAAAPRRQLHGRFWHQGSPRWPIESFADPARSEGRFHRRDGPGVWYASDQEQAAWAELFRHFLGEGVDPFEVLRRIGAVDVHGLEVLDLTDDSVRNGLGLDTEDLVGDDYRFTQDLADTVRAAGFQGLLAPSAALPGRRTLVVFEAGMDRLTFRTSRVRRPPPRLRTFRPS
jgi:RES domain-containing protein